MSNETISKFIERSLTELADCPEYRLPKTLIPEIVHLVEKYPNLDMHSLRAELKQDLRLLIENAKRQGALD
jgi:hypothetical protein